MTIQNFHPDELSLDRKNPRFGIQHAVSQSDALEILIDTADLRELWNSIAERGFEPFEPLVAAHEDGALVVLEGNRRLAAVKLLLDPSLLNKDIVRRRIPEVSEEHLRSCRSLPVTVVANREAAAGFIGFKHVNGPTRWSSLAKAKFGVTLYETIDQGKSPQERLQSLTKQLGDSRGLIIRLLVAYKVIMQSRDLGIFEQIETDETKIEFSHLYTLINNPDSREFLGLSRAPLSEGMIHDNPIPDEHISNLKEIMSWLYGPRSVIKSQGTDRPRLQRVLASQDGLRELRATGDLSSAEAVAGLQSEDWLGVLAKITALAQKANADAAIVVGELSTESREQAETFLERIKTYLRQVKSTFSDD